MALTARGEAYGPRRHDLRGFLAPLTDAIQGDRKGAFWPADQWLDAV